MAYLTLRIKCTEEQADVLSTLVLDLAFEGTSFEDGEWIAYASDSDVDLAPIERQIGKMGLQMSPPSQTADQNWNELWESNFHDLIVDSIHVRATFHKPKDLDYEIVIHPKMAFGTGHHGTTQLMLKAMTPLDFKGKQVLDMGCGSGILAIHASQRGAADVLAIDYDPNSTRNAAENVQLNHCTNVKIEQADNLDEVTNSFDIILSNIVKNINFSLVPAYKDKLRQGGHLVLCGLLHTDLHEAQQLAEALNLNIIDQKRQAEWLQLTLTHNL